MSSSTPATKNVTVQVKTSFGLTEEVALEEVVLQGEVWGPSLAANQMDTFGKEMIEEDFSFMYRYKGYVPVPLLGQIDDIIGVTMAGYKAVQLNSYINVKTADKYLQFGLDKCKAMIVGKQLEESHLPRLAVDVWESKHDKNGEFSESFTGKKHMENTTSMTYLGTEISADGKNLKNILQKRNKQIGKKRQITSLLKPVGMYTFECAVIFLNSLVRSSIMYGTEAMYNITQKDLRELEKIEEDQMKHVFQVKTGIQVPLHIMYLDLGQVPARYQVKRYKVNYLQYLLQQDETSLLYRMLRAQQENPVRGDWFSETRTILSELNIQISIEDIRSMTRKKFKKLYKPMSEAAAFDYLHKKQEAGSKGRNLHYTKKLEMANCLCPNNYLSVENQRQIFEIRSRSNPLPSNRGVIQHCNTGCGEIMNNSHVFQCDVLNQDKQQDYNIEMLTNGSLEEMKSALNIWNENMNKLKIIASLDLVNSC